MSNQKHEEAECKQADKIVRLDQEMGRLVKAVFIGNGQPSVIAQLAVLRQSMQTLSWLVGVTCVAVIGQIVAKIFSK
jgi:sorbitol-specific phosphotransferase system component IIBC